MSHNYIFKISKNIKATISACSWPQRLGARWSAGSSLCTNICACPSSAAAWRWTSWTGSWRPRRWLQTASSWWERQPSCWPVNRWVFAHWTIWTSSGASLPPPPWAFCSCPSRWRCARRASATSWPSAVMPSPGSSSATWNASSSSASTSAWTRPPWRFSWTITPTAPTLPGLKTQAAPGSPRSVQTADLPRRCVSWAWPTTLSTATRRPWSPALLSGWPLTWWTLGEASRRPLWVNWAPSKLGLKHQGTPRTLRATFPSSPRKRTRGSNAPWPRSAKTS